jgi:hypothetical protein
MKRFSPAKAGSLAVILSAVVCFSAPALYVSQVAYDSRGPKTAVVQADAQLTGVTTFTVIDSATSAVQYTDTLKGPFTVTEWASGKYFYRANFASFKNVGTFKVRATISGTVTTSESFRIDDNALAKLTFPWIVRYINKQRANTATEWQVDSTILLNDGSKTVNVRGGWDDDAGNSSKYMSHLNYANFFSPQQIPMCAWELSDAYERIPDLAAAVGMKDSLQAEALWGADYLYRVLTTDGYFYMVMFDFLNCTTSNRRVGGLLANSVMDNRWQCSFRAGGGMAIAALARISQWKKNGLYFTSQNYLDGAKRAFAHLLTNNLSYLYDGKENIIDDECALMAATELWIATDSTLYRDQARTRAQNLTTRMSTAGYFLADNGTRPFWSACDAGLPVWALVRYLDKETDQTRRTAALGTIKSALDYELAVTNRVSNPFGYARQNFTEANSTTVHEGFFIPQNNETGWWWQGENARLGSLATAAILGGRLVYPSSTNGWGIKDSLAEFASQQVAWVLGCNPYSTCFMYGFGKTYPPVTSACFGHQSSKGGISNGITGKSGNADGTGIDYNPPGGDSWRYTEQWIPHAIRMLAAVAAMAQTTPTKIKQPSAIQKCDALPRFWCSRTLLKVKLGSPLSAAERVMLYSPAGKKVCQWMLAKGTSEAALPLPRMSHGVYCMTIEKQGTYTVNLQ